MLPRSQPKNNRAGSDGLQQMKELMNALNERSRLPPPAVLTKGLMTFIRGKIRSPERLTQNQVRLLHLTFQHLIREAPQNANHSVSTHLSPADLEDILSALDQAEFEPNALGVVGEFAGSVFQQLRYNIELATPHDGEPRAQVVCTYISILSSSGFPMDALDVVESHWHRGLHATGVLPWTDVINGLAKTNNFSSVRVVMDKMGHCGAVLDQKSHELMTVALANKSSASAVRAVYETEIPGGVQPSVTATAAAIKAAIRGSDTAWASSLASKLPEEPSSTETADAALLLAAAAHVEGGDALEARLERMTEANPAMKSTLTIATVNTLLEFAVTARKLDLVESYENIAKKWELIPDSRTYRLQVEARVRGGDVQGAVSLYQQLEAEGLADQLDASILNQLIAGLCDGSQSETGYEMILSLTDRLTEMEGRIAPEVLGSLCNLMLYRQELEGASNLLRPIIDFYSPDELLQIRDGFMRYIFDAAEPTERVWEAYQLLNLAFPSTPVQERTRIMHIVFKRGRSDLACLVFGHMRQKEYADVRPTPDTYAECFAQLARSADAKGIHLVHNMLKLDLEIGLTTRVFNGLMLAYAACDMPDQAMDYFRDILHSKEGPSERTLLIFFRVCESFHNGVEEAAKMMEKLKSLDLRISADIYNAYIGALAGRCELERAVDAIRDMELKTGESPSSFT